MAKTKIHGEYLDPSVISGQTQVTAVGADSVLILDATDNALKKALLSDVIETVGSTPTFSQISATSDLTVDVGGSIILDADGTGIVDFKDGGTHIGRIENASSDFKLEARVQDKDIVLVGNDSGTGIEALRLDMSANGQLLGIANTPTNPTYSFAGDTNTGITRPTGDTLTIVTGGTERHRTGSTGKASWAAGGIGAVATQARDFTFYTEGSTNGVAIHSNDERLIFMGAAASSGTGVDTGYLQIENGGSAKIALNANGDSYFIGGSVGVGESSPAAPLHVEHSSGTAYNGASEITESLIVSNKAGTDDSGVNNVASIGLHVADGATSQGFINYVRTANNKGDFTFSQRTASSTYSESMRIKSDGYVSMYRNANEYGLELKSAGTRSGLVLKQPGTDNINGSLLLLADNTLRLGTASVYNMHMNQSGHNTMPNQPYIRCAGNQASMASNQGTTADYSNWADQVQRGITRSGAVFTVPTAGEYLITYSFYNWINNSGGGVTHAIYLKKGSTTVQEVTAEYDFENDSYSYYDNNLNGSLILNMAAGDTFKFTAYADIYGGSPHTNMSAYLLG